MTTPQTKSALTTEVNTNFPDNTTGLITPAILRTSLIDMLSSWIGLVDPTNPATGQITYPGTTTNDSATAGNVGEYIEGRVAVGSAVALVSGAAKTITSISLTPGDWDVQGLCITNGSSATMTTVQCSVSTTTNIPGTLPDGGNVITGANPVGGDLAVATATVRASLAVTTTYYMVMNVTFSGAAVSGWGKLRARRMR